MTELIKSIAIHGGAGGRIDTLHGQRNMQSQVRGLGRIICEGRARLLDGESALDVATHTLVALEAHEAFNAGFGASLRLRKRKNKPPKRIAELDASLMDGSTGKFAGAMGIKVMQHPSLVARHVLDHSPHSLFAGDGANDLAKEVAEAHGIKVLKNTKALETPYRRRRLEEWLADQEAQEKQQLGDTVGVVVFDGSNFSAGASTGGPVGVAEGRVGDVPIIGAGIWASEFGAASATGNGEDIMHEDLARRLVAEYNRYADLGGSQPPHISSTVLGRLLPNQSGGAIVLNEFGELGAVHTTELMPFASWSSAFDEPYVQPLFDRNDF